MEESIFVLKVACAGRAGCAEIPRQITVSHATAQKDALILATSHIGSSNLTELKELEYGRVTIVSKKYSSPH
jgi:hypothetical protein